MSRCGCSSGCSCVVKAGPGVLVEGTGSAGAPMVVTAKVSVDDGNALTVGSDGGLWANAAGPEGEAGPGVPAGGAAGAQLVKSSAADYDTAWQAGVPKTTPALLNGWVKFADAAIQGPHYRRTPDGLVVLGGLLSPGASGLGKVIFVLPPGCRPAFSELFPVYMFVSTSALSGRVDVLADGSVKHMLPTSTAGGTVVSLAGIAFYAEQ